jgi:glucose/arabinose dehydrogenase
VFQDALGVKTRFSKTLPIYFFSVGKMCGASLPTGSDICETCAVAGNHRPSHGCAGKRRTCADQCRRTETRSRYSLHHHEGGQFRSALAHRVPARRPHAGEEKVGRVDLVTPQGAKTELGGVPPSYSKGQDGMLGVFLSPGYATDHTVYLTYVEPGDYGGGVALGRGRLVLDGKPRLDGFKVLWRQVPTGKGGQPGGQIAFSPDGKYLFLTLGDRQRFTPAQDPNQPVGKILRPTLDGKPAPGNPWAGKVGASTIPLIDPPADTKAARTAPVVSTHTFPGPNLTPAETRGPISPSP